MEIMVELHGLWTLPPALRIAEALQEFDVAWLEEPVRYNALDAMAELARHTSIPIAASERLATAPDIPPADRGARRRSS